MIKTHKAFLITVIINGCIALADFVVGIFFLFEQHIAAMVGGYHGAFATTIASIFNHLSGQNQQMGILYFFSHSVIKLFLTWGLLTNRLWAYPLSIIFLSGFGIYQFFILFYQFSAFTLLLLVVNTVTVFFIAREYRSL
jgi:uncharacterized membrane protein